ncbi:aquaporin, partial [Streptococcus pneumoniae]|uniref:aquaporin n=1 Tax=Streptococcus pneumoniae TaxID=1313 RepID=UPI0015D7950A
FLGTLILILLGNGVVAGVVLPKTKSNSAGWIVITMGWGIAVAVAVFVSGKLSPAHLNPAVTVGVALKGDLPWASVLPYLGPRIMHSILPIPNKGDGDWSYAWIP